MRLIPGRRVFVSVFATTIFNLASIGATLAVLPRLLSEELGAPDPVVGIVTGAYALSGILMRPLAGRLADERGRRPIMVAGSVTTLTGALLLFLPPSVPGLLASRLLVGLGEGSLYTAGSAWIVDAAPVSRRGQWIGLYGLAVWTGLALGVPAAEALRQLAGYTAVWAFVIACCLASLSMALLAPRERREQGDEGSAERPAERGGYLEHKALGPGFVLMLSGVGFATISGFAILHLEEREIAGAALVFSCFAAAVILGRIVFGSLPDRYGPLPCATASVSVQIFGLALLAEASSLPVALLGSLLAGAASAIIFPSLSLLVVSRVMANRRGAAMGTFTALFDAGMLFGAPAAGVAASLGGYEASFLFAAFCAMVGAIATLRL